MKKNKHIKKFKVGDEITLNTDYRCDAGIFIKYENDNVVWQDKDGDRFKTPLSKFNITLNQSAENIKPYFICRISIKKRKYTSTPIVIVNEKGKEEIVLLSPLKKNKGDELLNKIVKLLNS